MLNFQYLLKKTILNEENYFFHGISFIVISLITIHVAIFFNFYKFSNQWFQSESLKNTFILSSNADEKIIPNPIIKKITSYLEDNNDLLDYEILDKDLIQGSLGIKDVDEIFGLSLPFVFLIQSADEQIIDEVYTSILKLGDNIIL